MSQIDAMPEPWRAGIFHRQRKDTVEVRLSPQPPPSPVSAVVAQDLDGDLRVQLRRGGDGRLYSLVVARASAALPAGVLDGRSGRVPGPGPLAQHPDYWFVPLFDGAERAGHRQVLLDDGTDRPVVTALLAASGHLTGFVVSDAAAHLPQSLISGSRGAP